MNTCNKASIEYFKDIEYTLMTNQKTSEIFVESLNPYIDYNSRSLVVDWIIESCNHLKVKDETCLLSVLILDNYIKHEHVIIQLERFNFKLIAIAAILIASKYEEIYPPDFEDFMKLDIRFSKEQLIKAESNILCELKYNVCFVTSIQLYGLMSLKINNNISNNNILIQLSKIVYVKLELFKNVLPSIICLVAFYIQWICQVDNKNIITKPEVFLDNYKISYSDFLFITYVLLPIQQSNITDAVSVLHQIKEVLGNVLIATEAIIRENEYNHFDLITATLKYFRLQFITIKSITNLELNESVGYTECSLFDILISIKVNNK